MAGFDFNADPDLAMKRQFAALLMKQGMDSSPVQHWTQGAARMANALVAGLAMKGAKEDQANALKKGADDFLGSTAQPDAAAIPQANPALASALTAGKIYNNDEPSPLDPPAGKDRDMLARALIGEAGNQGPQGMQAVADVVRNRAVAGNFGGDNVAGVLQAPKQFEPFNTQSGRDKMAAIDPNSPGYRQATAAIDRTYSGAPSAAPAGATHFYAPKAQAALGRPAPSWDNGQGVDVGDHRFFGGVGSPQVTAGATDMSAQSRQPTAPQPQRTAPQIPPEMRDRIYKLMTNPATAQMGYEMAAKYMQPSQPSYGVIGKDQFGNEQYGWIDPSRMTTTPNQQAGGGHSQAISITGPDGKPIAIPPGVDPKKFRADVTGATADALTGKQTEVQASSSNFANRMEAAERNLSGLEGEGTSIVGKALQDAPYGLSTVGNYLKSDNRQKYEQAKSQFITGLLRKDSGAVINKDEFARYDKEFFPQPGDSPDVIAQKKEARSVATEAMKKSAGPSYKSPAASTRPQSTESKTINGKTYIKQNGQWYEQ